MSETNNRNNKLFSHLYCRAHCYKQTNNVETGSGRIGLYAPKN